MSTTAPETSQDWRKDVTQQYRSSEVSTIAKVLASLDASTSAASKMMLASRFEDTCFKNASSLAEYRKMIVKRLKALQKNYVPTQAPPPGASEPPPTTTTTTTANATMIKPSSLSEPLQLQAAQQLQLLLQRSFNEGLTCISKYSKVAVQNALKKYGQERAFQLQQHINNALQWAVDIAVFPDDGSILALTDVVPPSSSIQETKSEPTIRAVIPIRSKVPWLLAFSSGESALNNAAYLYLQQVQKHLTQRVANIKIHVLKHSNFDLFMVENLASMEEGIIQKMNTASQGGEEGLGNRMYRHALMDESLKSMADEMGKMEEIQKWMEYASATVPIPRNHSEERKAGRVYLKKMEACSHIYMLYAALNKKNAGEMTTTRPPLIIENRNYLKRAYVIAMDSCDSLAKLCMHAKASTKNPTETDPDKAKVGPDISLEDAWNKIMVYDGRDRSKSHDTPNVIQEDRMLEEVDVDVDINFLPPKRPRMEAREKLQISDCRSYPTVIRTKVLAKPGRRLLPPFIHALKQKEAELEGHDGVARIKMTFGQAFEMYIYFSPLLVAIRAAKSPPSSLASMAFSRDGDGLTTLPPINRGLVKSTGFLQVMGVRGDYMSVGHLVSKKLEFASARATSILRRCFSEECSKISKLPDSDIEILEASTMIKFLQMARMTFVNSNEEKSLS